MDTSFQPIRPVGTLIVLNYELFCISKTDGLLLDFVSRHVVAGRIYL
jgi:hypothetical protein